MTALHRAATIPVIATLMLFILLTGPIYLVVAGLVSLTTRSSRPLRSVALVMAYALIELRTLAKLLGGDRDCDRLMFDFGSMAHDAVRRLLDVEVAIGPGSVTSEEIPDGAPVIVLSRHCGPGDSILIAWLLMTEYRLQVRVVARAALRLEPVFDVAGQLGCVCFVSHGDRARAQIRDLAASLSSGQALLLFPEGANFSVSRWRATIAELRSTGRIRAAARAFRQSHTLPPRAGGAIAAVSGAPSASVLVLSHTGFCPDGRARPWWQLPIHRQLLVHTELFRADQRPRPDEISAWLEQTWARIDSWVAEQADHP
ncbi:1-acyl-sn-glycerol-3-phosphate acyltransferase [Mycobacterium sp. 155]|uniref:1-acyl-sn-glycerol-3-phosphate acyltransferase n=1 Tax=Mycobacterium sp. 155 TaxID=1157943 RepID=UPI00036CB418|nr:1-acyl-sn-glycerol-3-phosphate acyltransferase [Mycobacterium sp. 155]